MSEIAIVAARKVRLQQRAEDGDERARSALALAHDPNKFLSTVQFGITMVGVLAGAYITQPNVLSKSMPCSL